MPVRRQAQACPTGTAALHSTLLAMAINQGAVRGKKLHGRDATWAWLSAACLGGLVVFKEVWVHAAVDGAQRMLQAWELPWSIRLAGQVPPAAAPLLQQLARSLDERSLRLTSRAQILALGPNPCQPNPRQAYAAPVTLAARAARRRQLAPPLISERSSPQPGFSLSLIYVLAKPCGFRWRVAPETARERVAAAPNPPLQYERLHKRRGSSWEECEHWK